MRLMRLLTLTIFALNLACSIADKRVDALTALREDSASGVIRLPADDFMKFTSTPRAYSIIVFGSAAKLKESANVRLSELFASFKLFAAHVRNAGHKPEYAEAVSKIFFVEIDVMEERDLAQRRLGVNSVPFVAHLGPSHVPTSSGTFKIAEADKMRVADYAAYPWVPEDFRDFVQKRTQLDFGQVHIPSLLNSPVFLAIVAALLIPATWGAWKIYTAPWFGHPALWAAATLAVFMFATSGGLYNIIRNIPMYTISPEGKFMWYMPGQSQLGLEGFTVGSMYVGFALCCTGLISLPTYIAGKPYFRVTCYACYAGAVLLFFQIISFYKWKSGGYRWRFYLGDWLLGIRR